jgi:hypothetical protein
MTRSKGKDIKDEPGAEERFKRGIERALKTPPKPHKEAIKNRKDDRARKSRMETKFQK